MSDLTPNTLRIPSEPYGEPSLAGGGSTPGPDQDFALEPAPARRQSLGWAALSAVIVAILFCFGQLALLMPLSFPAADTRSNMKADYSLWPEVALQPVSAEVIEDVRGEAPGELVVFGEYWGQPTLPSPTPPEMTPTPLPTMDDAEPVVLLVAATVTPPRALATPWFPPTATRRQILPTPLPTRTNPPRVRLPTSTLRPTNTPFSVFVETNTPRPPYHSPTPSLTPSLTPTWTPVTPTFIVPPFLPTDTHTPMPTPTITNTPIPSLTPTSTPIGNISEGPPDASWEPISCGEAAVVDFGESRQINSLVFYEFYNSSDGCGQIIGGNFVLGICMDGLQVWLSDTPDYQADGVMVFSWGDTLPDNNGFIFPYHYRPSNPLPEYDNEGIPWVELFPQSGTDPRLRTGVCVDVNPDAAYRYLVFAVPPNNPPASYCNDEGEIDAFEININLNECPLPAAGTGTRTGSLSWNGGPR